MKIYCVKDEDNDGYGTPQFVVNDTIAVRTFKTVVQQEGSNIHLYPDRHNLYCIGEYDSSKGTITPMKNPTLIAQGEFFRTDDQKDQMSMLDNQGKGE